MKNKITSILFLTALTVLTFSVFGIEAGVIISCFGVTHLFATKAANSLALNATNNISARDSYERAKRMFARAMLDKFQEKYGASAWQKALEWAESLKLTQSEVRREVQLTTTAQTFAFGLTVNQSSQGATGLFNTEIPLQQQDSLCVQEYGIFIRKPASATSTIDQPETYANPNTFNTANVATAANGTFFGNGQFSITVNNDIVLPSRGLYNHFYVPQTQGAVGITAQTIFPLDQKRGAEDGFITSEPNIVLIGSKNYVPRITLPVALAAVETNQRAVVIFRGILAQNSTIIN